MERARPELTSRLRLRGTALAAVPYALLPGARAGAGSTAAVCGTYGIRKDRAHIIGQYEVPGSDHTDPGPNWDWVRYLRLVNFA
jgi:hypothetical protein